MEKQLAIEAHETGKNRGNTPGSEFEPYKTYWIHTGPASKVKRLGRKLRRRGWRTLIYEKEYARSKNYRSAFFETYPSKDGMYRCAYCGRYLTRSTLVVDHVIPVGQAKKNKRAQRMLHGRGVNDPSNLVAACNRCNMRKSDKMGIWRLRAALGRHPMWFTIRNIIIAVLVCGTILIIANPELRVAAIKLIEDIFCLMGEGLKKLGELWVKLLTWMETAG